MKEHHPSAQRKRPSRTRVCKQKMCSSNRCDVHTVRRQSISPESRRSEILTKQIRTEKETRRRVREVKMAAVRLLYSQNTGLEVWFMYLTWTNKSITHRWSLINLTRANAERSERRGASPPQPWDETEPQMFWSKCRWNATVISSENWSESSCFVPNKSALLPPEQRLDILPLEADNISSSRHNRGLFLAPQSLK